MTEADPSRIITEVAFPCNEEEFLRLYKCLFTKSFSQRQYAIENIQRLRRLPAAVGVTVSLVTIMVEDDKYKLGLPLVGHFGRLIAINSDRFYSYSSALRRFVIFVTKRHPMDVCRCLMDYKQQIGVIKLLDLAANSVISNTSWLRYNAEMALKLLDEKYWKKMCSSFTGFIPQNVVSQEAKMIASVGVFFDCQFMLFTSTDDELKKKMSSQLDVILNEIKNFLTKSSDEFFDVLIQPGHFLYPTEYVYQFLPKEDYKLLNGDYNLPLFMQELWGPIIDVINSEHLIKEFVSKLLTKQENMSQKYQLIACAWAWKLISIVLNDDCLDSSNPIVKIYQTKKWCFDWHVLVSICVANSFMYIPAILLPIIDLADPPLSEKQKSSLIGTYALFSREVPQTTEREEMRSYTWDKLRLGIDVRYWLSDEFKKAALERKNKRVKTSDAEKTVMDQGAASNSAASDLMLWSSMWISMNWGE